MFPMITRGAESISQITNANHQEEGLVTAGVQNADKENAEGNVSDIVVQSNTSKKPRVDYALIAARDIYEVFGGENDDDGGELLDVNKMAENIANAKCSDNNIVVRVASGSGGGGGRRKSNGNTSHKPTGGVAGQRENPNEACVAQSNRVDYALMAARDIYESFGGENDDDGGELLDVNKMAENIAKAERSDKCNIVGRVFSGSGHFPRAAVSTVFEFRFDGSLVLRTVNHENELYHDMIVGDPYKRLVEDKTLQDDSQTMGQLLSINEMSKTSLVMTIGRHAGRFAEARYNSGQPFKKLVVSSVKGNFGPDDLGWKSARAEWEASWRSDLLIEQQQAHWSGLSSNPMSIDDKIDFAEQLGSISAGHWLKKSIQVKTRFAIVFNILKSALRTLPSSEYVSTRDAIATMANAIADARVGLEWTNSTRNTIEEVTIEDVCINSIINALANDDSVHQSRFKHLAANQSGLPRGLVLGSNAAERKKNTTVQVITKIKISAVPTSSHELLLPELSALLHVLNKVGPFINDDYETKSNNEKKTTLVDIMNTAKYRKKLRKQWTISKMVLKKTLLRNLPNVLVCEIGSYLVHDGIDH